MLASLKPETRAGLWAVVQVPEEHPALQHVAEARVREQEGWTLVLPVEEAATAGQEPWFVGRWITLGVNSSLSAVGLTAAVSSVLARHGIACNVIAAASHDHLLVPLERTEEAMALLHALQQTHASPAWLAGMHHVAIIAADYSRSRDFYTRILGLRVVHEVYREARQSWKLDLQLPDGSQIELFSFPGAPSRPSRPEAQGLRHLSFRVPDLDAAIARLEAFGVAVEAVRVDEYTGRRFTFFADPDELPLELYEVPDFG